MDISVVSLVDKITSGELVLPEMQRRYIWPATRVRDLLDSLYRGYPSGAILVWESRQEVPTREAAVEQRKSPWAGYKLLLDGQQRLTSLAAVLRGEQVKVRNKKRPIEILFNLEHPEGPPPEVLEIEDDDARPELDDDTEPDADDSEDEGQVVVERRDVEKLVRQGVMTRELADEVLRKLADAELRKMVTVQERLAQRTFVVASKALLAIPTWLKVSDVFNESKSDWDLLKPIGIKPDDPKYSMYCKRLQKLRNIKNYQYVMHVLEDSLSYEEVAEIFVRVNSLGIKLRGSDLALAQITAKWPNSLRVFEEYAEHCEDKTWFSLDVGLLVRTMVVFATGQSKFRTVGAIPRKTLEESWEKAKEGLDFAVNFLRTNAGVEDESLLSSPLLIVALAAYGGAHSNQLTSDEQRELLRWLYVANARGHFSRGSTETYLDADLNLIFKAGGGPAELTKALLQQLGRLHVEPADLAGKGTQSSLFPMAFLALKKGGARDWMSGLGISLTHQGKLHYIQHHHIFPKSRLKEAGYEPSEINEIANFAFISGKANRSISNKPPVDYLPAIIDKYGREAIEKQLIPMEQGLWKIEAYRDFLKWRREALTSAINSFMGVEAVKLAPRLSVLNAKEIMSKGESGTVEFKASARWDYRENRHNPGLMQPVLKTVAAFMNCSGGTLLIGVDDHGKAVGLKPDYQTINKRPDSDGYEQFLIQSFSAQIGKEYCPYLSVTFHAVDGHEICAIQVQPALKPAYVQEGNEQKLYVRTGNSSQALTTKEAIAYVKEHWSG